MPELAEKVSIDFATYPPVGGDDWRYTFATAKVRALETQLIGRATLVDMANAPDYEQAAGMLSATEYAVATTRDFLEVKELLKQRRSELRQLFASLMLDEPLMELLKERDDFANLRLALRRKLTDRPLGTDYSDDGSIPAEQFEQIFEEENYAPLPEHMQEAIEAAVLAYYQDKDVRQIDYALDSYQAEYKIRRAIEIGSIFLEGLFRTQADLINIKTMLRLKFGERDERNVFLQGGYIEHGLLRHCLDVGYEAVAAPFFATPYYELIESGVNYLSGEKSFLRLEAYCDRHVGGFLDQTLQITAGPQPVIAYLLTKESEIRNVRLVLTAKRNNLDGRLILDRLGE